MLEQSMSPSVAISAKRNEVVLRVVAALATKHSMMDLKIGHCATGLASPAVSLEHLAMELPVSLGYKSEPGPFGKYRFHEAFVCSSARNASFCVFGRKR